MRMLVTGAHGFVGRHVAAAAAVDHTVFRATRGERAGSADELALGRGFWTRAVIARALAASMPDVVLHCAGTTRARDAGELFEANAGLTAELLDAVADHGAATRVILIGSAAEYGMVPAVSQPVAETWSCNPQSAYAVAKHAQTLLGLAAARVGQPVLTARLFNAVGPGMPAGLALPSFARQLVGGATVLRVGDLSAARDFIDVAEVARLLVALAVLAHWPWPIVNLCSGQAYRLGALLDGLIKANGTPVQVEIDPALVRAGDMRSLTGDGRRLTAVGLAARPPDFHRLLPQVLAHARA